MSASATRRIRFRAAAVRLTEADSVALGVVDYARLHDVGGKIGDRTDHPARLDGRDYGPTRVDTLEAKPLELATMVLEVPPRDAVLRAHDDGVGPEERRQLGGQPGQAVRLHPEKDHIGRSDDSQVADDLGADFEITVCRDHPQPTLLHGVEVRAPREEHDIGSGAGKPRADVPADGTGPCNDDLHGAVDANACATMRRWIFPVAVRGMASVM